MDKTIIFRPANKCYETLDTLYLHLSASGKVHWNIDIPHLKFWERSGLDEYILLDSDNRVSGLIQRHESGWKLCFDNSVFYSANKPECISPETTGEVFEAFEELDIYSLNSVSQNSLCSPEHFTDSATICWLNKSEKIARRRASRHSRVIGESTEMTRKWEGIFNLVDGGLPSPDVYLLYLRDAYVLNGSLVFTNDGKFVGCTKQLGFTLGPWTNFCSGSIDNSSELKYLKDIAQNKVVALDADSFCSSLDSDKSYFLYSTCHTGFGHHLGQSTPSSYFLNRIKEENPDEYSDIVCIYRGGLRYEPFREGLYSLSLNQTPKTLSLTRGLFRVPRLIVPSTLSNYGVHWHALGSLYRTMRDRARERSSLSLIDLDRSYSGLFLSRRGYRRGCSNGEQLSKLLTSLGFLEYSPPGSLNIIDQIALMSHFSIFFSAYGSGANNILFGQDSSHLVQPLCSVSDGQSWDYASAQIVNANYTYIFGAPDNPSASFHDREYKYDLDVISYVLKQIIAENSKPRTRLNWIRW